jgi:hypothetical protein
MASTQTVGCIADILAEHIDELPFDLSQRSAMLRSPRHTIVDLRRLDGRIAARIDGLRLGGTGALALAEPMLGSDGEHDIAAGTLAALAAMGAEAWPRIDGAVRRPDAGASIALALGLWPDELPEAMSAWLADSDPLVRLAATETLVARGQAISVDDELLAHADARMRSRAAALAGPTRIARMLDDGDPSVRAAALAAAAWSGWPEIAAHCRARCRESGAGLEMLALIGDPCDDALLLARCEDRGLGCRRFALAATWAHPAVVPTLLDGIDSAEPAEAIAAGDAFTRMFSEDIESDVRAVVPPIAGDAFSSAFADESFLPDRARAHAHWRRVQPRLGSSRRIVCGSSDPAAPAPDWDLLSHHQVCLRAAIRGSSADRHETVRLLR